MYTLAKEIQDKVQLAKLLNQTENIESNRYISPLLKEKAMRERLENEIKETKEMLKLH